MNLLYSVTNYDLNRDNGTPDDWSVTGRCSLAFDILGSPNFGKIVGRVVNDLNGNRIAEYNEPGVEDVYVKIRFGREAKTDSKGYFSFDRVAPGEQEVGLDFEDIPINLGIEGSSDKTVFVNARKSSKAEFFLIEMGDIEGRLYIDNNGNSKFDSDDDTVEGVIVSLLPIERRTVTDKEGKFSFDYLYPKTYTIQLDIANLPKGYSLSSPEEWEMKVPIGGKVKGVDFILKEKTYKIQRFGTADKE